MKTIFDQSIRNQLIERIKQINENHQAAWGKMNVFQMLQHNTYWNAWILGKNKATYKQSLLGKIFGKMALNKMLKDEKPFDKNVPTSRQFKAKKLSGDLTSEKAKWIYLIQEYENFSNPGFIHDFFGKMNKEQIGRLAYKHTDHHLRQFGL